MTNMKNHLITLEWKIRDEQLNLDKLIRALSEAKGVLVEKVKFDFTKKDYLTQHFFSTLPTSSIYFLKELPSSSETLNKAHCLRLAFVDGFHVNLAGSDINFEKDLWAPFRKVDIDNMAWSLNEIPIGEDFIKIRKIMYKFHFFPFLTIF